MVMSKLNWIFTWSSISVLLVTIERFSFTTKILLQPYGYLRLHEMFQMVVIILLTVVIPFYLLKEVTSNFETIRSQKGFLLMLAFIIGIYFYSTGNGLHEVSSFNFNQFCDTEHFSNHLCQTFFFNDYYTGNILYFIGGALMVIPLMLLEKINPNKKYQKKDLAATIINAVIYALAIFAYSAFDRVLVGLIYSIIITVFAVILFIPLRKKYLQYPITFYTLLTYGLGTVAALLVRFH